LHAPLFDVPLLQLGKLPRVLLVQPFYDILPPEQSPTAKTEQTFAAKSPRRSLHRKKGPPPPIPFLRLLLRDRNRWRRDRRMSRARSSYGMAWHGTEAWHSA
jgi:hypothetical protein